jgi:hypothetical protein
MLLILPVTVLVAEMIGRQASLYTAGHETYLIHYSQSREAILKVMIITPSFQNFMPKSSQSQYQADNLGCLCFFTACYTEELKSKTTEHRFFTFNILSYDHKVRLLG